MCGSVADADPDGEVHGRADRDDGDSDGERDDPSITSSSPRSWPQAGSETMVERPVPLGRDGEAPVQALRPLTTACWEVGARPRPGGDGRIRTSERVSPL
jgi:hypothetical protein